MSEGTAGLHPVGRGSTPWLGTKLMGELRSGLRDWPAPSRLEFDSLFLHHALFVQPERIQGREPCDTGSNPVEGTLPQV